jgi:hypothetical protein
LEGPASLYMVPAVGASIWNVSRAELCATSAPPNDLELPCGVLCRAPRGRTPHRVPRFVGRLDSDIGSTLSKAWAGRKGWSFLPMSSACQARRAVPRSPTSTDYAHATVSEPMRDAPTAARQRPRTPTCETDPPSCEADPPACKADPPACKADPPTCKPDPSSCETDPPTGKTAPLLMDEDAALRRY